MDDLGRPCRQSGLLACLKLEKGEVPKRRENMIPRKENLEKGKGRGKHLGAGNALDLGERNMFLY